MTDAPETIQRLQSSLEPYIKPREQVNYIRRVLALHLGYSAHDAPIKHPLSLVDDWQGPGSVDDVKGLQREYVEALNANIAARRQFDKVVQADRPSSVGAAAPATDGPELLQERVGLLKLQKKRDRLLAVQRHLDILTQEPAATSDFLNVDDLFQDATALPSVPKEVVNRIVAGKSSSQPDIKARATQLEKKVLRAKLLSKQEEQQLREAKARSQGRLDIVSNSARLEALNTTRNELINWIETELSNVSTEEPEQVDEEVQGNGQLQEDQATVTAHLAEIKAKYAKYVASRKALIALVALRPQPALPPPVQRQVTTTTTTDSPTPAPVNHLLTPYIEALLSVSRKQKAVIAQKSHTKSILSKQTKDACQTLGHLAEESQILPVYPMKESLRRRSGLWTELTTRSSERPDVSNRIKPWIFAADSAKMATLESVAETVEGGQVALESSMRAIQDIERLLCRDRLNETNATDAVETAEEDVWLETETNKNPNARKHSEKKKGAGKEKNDMWSGLNGNLGLISLDDST